MKLTLERINDCDQKSFCEIFGSLFERSPWVAERAWFRRPFASYDHLFNQMEQTLRDADEEEQLAVLQSHPDLGARIEMTEDSVKEQSSAGLDQLTPEEYNDFLLLNQSYRQKFQFPFIMAVRGQNKETIRQEMERRMHHTRDEEKCKALDEVCKIARFRLQEIVQLNF